MWAKRLGLDGLRGRAQQLEQTWEVYAWEIVHLETCYLGKYTWKVAAMEICLWESSKHFQTKYSENANIFYKITNISQQSVHKFEML